MGAERGGEDFAGVRAGRRAVANVAGGGLVEEDQEVPFGGIEDLDAMRIGASNELGVALFEIPGVDGAVGVHHGHAR